MREEETERTVEAHSCCSPSRPNRNDAVPAAGYSGRSTAEITCHATTWPSPDGNRFRRATGGSPRYLINPSAASRMRFFAASLNRFVTLLRAILVRDFH
jgi:hypothetical protein